MHDLLNSAKMQAEVGELLGGAANTIGRESRKNKYGKKIRINIREYKRLVKVC